MTQNHNGEALIFDSSSIAFARRLIAGTRGSALAQWQTNYVCSLLKGLAPELEIERRIVKTSGDRDQNRALAEMGGLGVFTKELQNSLLDHEVDFAVHSLKDLPTDAVEGLVLGAIPERDDARDCLVSRLRVGVMQLLEHARVGTSSARRKAQLLAIRPDFQIVPLRGNVDTRLRKAQSDEYDAIVLAAAGLKRLARTDEITEYLSFDTMLPDPGQGALAVELRAADRALAALLSRIDHAASRAAVFAERSFLRALGGGCRMPIGAYAELGGAGLSLSGMVASLDGGQIVRGEISGTPERAEELGVELAERLQSEGAAEILGGEPFHLYPAPVHLPLRGKRVLITRAQGQAGALAEQVCALGGEPIQFPTIDFAPVEDYGELDAALGHVSDYDWVVFTSANGVRAVASRVRELGLIVSVLARCKLGAIGPATAQALEQINLKADFVPTRFLGEQVAIELPVTPGERILLLRADIASDVLARGLADRGARVTNVVAYRTILPPAQEIDFKQVDAVTFTSSSTVRNLIELGDGQLPDKLAVFCIGPVTAQTARELGLLVTAIAGEHTTEGLVRAMAEYYERGE